jgi:FAD:protein FMN transferase
MELDPGGIGKSYAVDRVVSVLKERGTQSPLVSASGSSLYGMGRLPTNLGAGPLRSVPRRPTAAGDRSLLEASGSYEKFFRADGRMYSHLIDPRTGIRPRGWPRFR